jgi:hypothetical protein
LIKASWFRSYADDRDTRVRRDVFDREQNARIDRLLQANLPIAITLAAVPDEVISWVCRDQETIHYVYTKFAFRRQGLASRLIKGAEFYSCETKGARALFKQMLFNPFKAG